MARKTYIVDRGFQSIPPELRREIDHVVGDGTVSQRDVQHIASRADTAGVMDTTRNELVGLMETWAQEDEQVLAS